MIYYPLQLLQLAGITRRAPRHGEGPRGSDDRPPRRRAARAARRRRPDPRARSHVQGADGARRYRAGRRHGARTSPAGAPLVVVLGDNIFEFAQSASAPRVGGEPVARADLRQGGRRSGELRRRRLRRRRRGRGHRREGRRRRHEVRRAADVARGRRSLLLPAGRLRRHRDAEPVGARRARDHRREPSLRARRDGSTPPRSTGWWEDAGKHWQHLADIGRRIDETGANKRDAA